MEDILIGKKQHLHSVRAVLSVPLGRWHQGRGLLTMPERAALWQVIFKALITICELI